MTNQSDNRAKMRSAAFMSELEIAKKSSHTGALGLIIRVTLVVVFAYLILTSYVLFGVNGPIFISVLFIVALFVPYMYRSHAKRLKKNRGQRVDAKLAEESPQEG